MNLGVRVNMITEPICTNTGWGEEKNGSTFRTFLRTFLGPWGDVVKRWVQPKPIVILTGNFVPCYGKRIVFLRVKYWSLRILR